MDPLLASIILFASNFAPRGWAFCQGQILSIAQNQALFSLLGTTYGGNGTTTFALPDFRGRVPVGTGQGPGFSLVDLGEMAGTPTVTLLQTQMPQHVHTVSTTVTISVSNSNAISSIPTASMNTIAAPYDVGNDNPIAGFNDLTPNTVLNGATVGGTTGIAGSSQPFSIMQPYLGMNFIIALEGIFPTRN